MTREYLCCLLDAEVEELKKRASGEYKLENGELFSIATDCSIYKFENSLLLNLPEGAAIEVSINREIHKGNISVCDRDMILLMIENCSRQYIDSLYLKIQAWRLTEKLRTKLQFLQYNKLVRELENAHINGFSPVERIITGQEAALAHILKDNLTFIWGPPGTGKTYVLAEAVSELARVNKRILIISQSNIAVDSAVIQMIKVLGDRVKGRLFRYGMIKEDKLENEHPEIDIQKYILSTKPKLKIEYDYLKDHIKDFGGENYNLYLKRRRVLLNSVENKEANLLNKDNIIVATTATKAIISDLFNQPNSWDIIFFDEISMALVPQVLVAASMSRDKLVLIGDYKQLSSIVVGQNNRELGTNIFTYTRMEKDGKVIPNEKLVLLDIQRRMNPDISDFVNKRIYSGLIKDASEISKTTARIKDSLPLKGKALGFVDLAGYENTCFTSVHYSRFNILSALASISLALNVADSKYEIGIITPYAAQSEIINAIIKEFEGINVKLPIMCSTVHQFQGYEKDIIIFDTVESFPKRNTGQLLSERDDSTVASELINVAVTRAKGKFIIVADSDYIKDHLNDYSPVLRELINYAKGIKYVKGKETL